MNATANERTESEWGHAGPHQTPGSSPKPQAADGSATIGMLIRLRTIKSVVIAKRKEFFWAWIAYQAIKGTITTSLVWLPALMYWFN